MKKIFLIITIIISINQYIKSQDKNSSFLVMGVPQYLITNGLRIDFDLKTQKPKKWVVLSPIIYLNQNSDNYMFDENIYGGGLEITFKQFLSKEDNGKGVYVAYGLRYVYNNIEKEGEYWIERNKLYYEETGKYTTQIHKSGLNCFLGTQFDITKNLLADVYIGFGFRYSLLDYSKGEGSRFSSSWIDYGYSGILLVSGIRIGVGL